MKKFHFYLVCVSFTAISFSAKAQFQSVQLMSSVEYVKFSSSLDPELGIEGAIKRPLSHRFGVDAQWSLTSKVSLRTGLRFSTIRQLRKNILLLIISC